MQYFAVSELSGEERTFVQRKFPKSILSLLVDADVVALYYECKCKYKEGTEPVTSFEFGLLRPNNNPGHLYKVPVYRAKKAQVAESCSRELRRAGIFGFTHSPFYKGNLTVYGLSCENVSTRQIGGIGITGFAPNANARKELSDFLAKV